MPEEIFAENWQSIKYGGIRKGSWYQGVVESGVREWENCSWENEGITARENEELWPAASQGHTARFTIQILVQCLLPQNTMRFESPPIFHRFVQSRIKARGLGIYTHFGEILKLAAKQNKTFSFIWYFEVDNQYFQIPSSLRRIILEDHILVISFLDYDEKTIYPGKINLVISDLKESWCAAKIFQLFIGCTLSNPLLLHCILIP